MRRVGTAYHSSAERLSGQAGPTPGTEKTHERKDRGMGFQMRRVGTAHQHFANAHQNP